MPSRESKYSKMKALLSTELPIRFGDSKTYSISTLNTSLSLKVSKASSKINVDLDPVNRAEL